MPRWADLTIAASLMLAGCQHVPGLSPQLSVTLTPADGAGEMGHGSVRNREGGEILVVLAGHSYVGTWSRRGPARADGSSGEAYLTDLDGGSIRCTLDVGGRGACRTEDGRLYNLSIR